MMVDFNKPLRDKKTQKPVVYLEEVALSPEEKMYVFGIRKAPRAWEIMEVPQSGVENIIENVPEEHELNLYWHTIDDVLMAASPGSEEESDLLDDISWKFVRTITVEV